MKLPTPTPNDWVIWGILVPIFFISRQRKKIWEQSQAGHNLAKQYETVISDAQKAVGGEPIESVEKMKEHLVDLKVVSAAMVFPYWISPHTFRICLIYSIVTFALSITAVPGFIVGFLRCAPRVAYWVATTFFAKK